MNSNPAQLSVACIKAAYATEQEDGSSYGSNMVQPEFVRFELVQLP